ncbi:alpha/beta fold hydrolase [Hyphomonas johnsonii]|uniref:Alpha/beta hydrolase fold protein n=1 Tax=Hyphomonas johnsonii MHS-2 TaxID=1280950 RepID=A0A059FPA4_9PROT|nr:alpha/beta fold hydrolase [Hyphomonas johnsonii]KCZ92464.1 alpha/beta hydrolase fold protein [Hyphomonas johnsonii MHS-2]
MATFILVHGAWHGGWCWERVTPLLEAAGHTVIAPDLPGMGQDTTPLASVSLELWARFVADLAARQPEPVILVGHSRGGIVISQAGEYAPASIRGLVYLTAFLVQDGQSLLATMQRTPRDPALPPEFEPSEDGTTLSLVPGAAARTFYNTTEPAWQARAAALVGPEPAVAFTTPVAISGARYGSVRRAYVECLQDRAIPIKAQRMMQADLPCERVVTLDCDHSPFYAAPDALAEGLVGLAEHFADQAE